MTESPQAGAAGKPGAWLCAAGVIALLASAQAFVFERQLAAATEAVPQTVLDLQQERNDNGNMNEALRALQLYQRASSDEQVKRAVFDVRDLVLERYAEDRPGAVEALRAAARDFEARTPAEQGALAELEARVATLGELYANPSGAALDHYLDPPWYLQPTASFLNGDAARLHALGMNHVLYLAHSGDAEAAIALLESMRGGDARQAADVDVMLARLAFEAWTVEPQPPLFVEALERTTRGVREAPEQPLPKLFLEYLLSLDRTAEKVDQDPEEGQGDGEGQGERGVISTERREF